MDKRLYPISREFFDREILPHIADQQIKSGRPPRVSHYQVFCAILYVLRTGISWRDLPACYGGWHTVYLRFKRGSDRGLWWQILIMLQQKKQIKMKVVLADSTTVKIHRHGGASKGGSIVEASTAQA